METIKIIDDTPRGFRIINKADFDPKVHTEFGKAKAPVKRRGSK
jgi:hypothetical protein